MQQDPEGSSVASTTRELKKDMWEETEVNRGRPHSPQIIRFKHLSRFCFMRNEKTMGTQKK